MKACCQIEDPAKEVKKLKIRFLIVGLVLVASLAAGAVMARHPLHLTNTEITYNSRTQALEVSVRIFSDDLQAVLKKHYGAPLLFIGEARESAEASQYFARYMKDVLKITAGGKPVPLAWVGHEQTSDGATWFHLEATGYARAPTKYTVQQQALCGLYADQTNKVSIRAGENRETMLLTCTASMGKVGF